MSSPQLGTVLCQNLWDLLVPTRPFLSDHPALKFRLGDAKMLMGGRIPPRQPYNLRTGYNCTAASPINVSTQNT